MNCASARSAGCSGCQGRPCCCAYSSNARRAWRSPTMRSASASSSPPRTLPAQPPGPSAGRCTYGSRYGAAQQLLLQARPLPRRDEQEHADVEQQRPERAMGQRVPAAQAEQLFRPQPVDAERTVLDPAARSSQPHVRQRRQQQRVSPQHGAGEQAGERAGAAGAAPVQAADQRRRELRDRGEREQAVLRRACLARAVAAPR